jgi:ArsR family transcriptional regulator
MKRCSAPEHSHDQAQPALAPDQSLEKAAGLFRALGDAPRLRLLSLLTKGERCVSELVAALDENFSTVSQRLRVLRTEGLVARRREGTHLYYALADRHVLDLLRNALDHAAELPRQLAARNEKGSRKPSERSGDEP